MKTNRIIKKEEQKEALPVVKKPKVFSFKLHQLNENGGVFDGNGCYETFEITLSQRGVIFNGNGLQEDIFDRIDIVNENSGCEIIAVRGNIGMIKEVKGCFLPLIDDEWKKEVINNIKEYNKIKSGISTLSAYERLKFLDIPINDIINYCEASYQLGFNPLPNIRTIFSPLGIKISFSYNEGGEDLPLYFENFEQIERDEIVVVLDTGYNYPVESVCLVCREGILTD